MESKNLVKIRGTVRRKVRGNGWLVLCVITGANQSSKRDLPNIYWYGDDIDMIDSAYEPGDRVTITARIQTSKKYRSQSIVGIDIENTPREMEEKFGLHNVGRYLQDENEVILQGELVGIYEPPNTNRMCVATIKAISENGFIGYPQITFFERQYDKIKQMNIGDPICAVSHIQTSRKQRGDQTNYYESVVCHYIPPVIVDNYQQENYAQ